MRPSSPSKPSHTCLVLANLEQSTTTSGLPHNAQSIFTSEVHSSRPRSGNHVATSSSPKDQNDQHKQSVEGMLSEHTSQASSGALTAPPPPTPPSVTLTGCQVVPSQSWIRRFKQITLTEVTQEISKNCPTAIHRLDESIR